jgi:acyl-CoA thioester hydrolase
MGEMIEVARSSVQTWECDQMGHMNVQFYVAKAEEGAAALATALGLGHHVQRENGTVLVAREHHIRFLRELRPGAPFIIKGGVLRAMTEGLEIYEELRTVIPDEVSATFYTRAEWCDHQMRGGLPLPTTALAKVAPYSIELPKHGAPRGLELSLPRPAPHLKDTERMNMITTYRGAVHPEFCDRAGFMTPRHYMGRVSDAIPNLLAQMRNEDRSKSQTGGAALEYRFVYREPAREGDVLVLKSGLKSVGEKTYIWCHWLFDAESGDCFATAEAVAVAMDLATRKAIEIPPDMRKHLESLVIPGLSV